ncbi:MAG: hypothetical protein SF187_08325 [Deltaproteobacteria bacterium]|nr:hypothetical protein [Deltaproteobacteria bacterium]
MSARVVVAVEEEVVEVVVTKAVAIRVVVVATQQAPAAREERPAVARGAAHRPAAKADPAPEVQEAPRREAPVGLADLGMVVQGEPLWVAVAACQLTR